MLAPNAVIDIPVEPFIDPVFEPSRLVSRIRLNEKFHLHLLELARAKNEIARRDLVAERFAYLRHTERQLHALRIHYVGKAEKDALGGLGAQIYLVRAVLHRTHEGLEHQVEAACLGQLTSALGA